VGDRRPAHLERRWRACGRTTASRSGPSTGRTRTSSAACPSGTARWVLLRPARARRCRSTACSDSGSTEPATRCGPPRRSSSPPCSPRRTTSRS
jgi:hypothetical protein